MPTVATIAMLDVISMTLSGLLIGAHPCPRTNLTNAGRATRVDTQKITTPVNAATWTAVNASEGTARSCRGVTRSQCSAYLANPDPATTKRAHAHRTTSDAPRTRRSGSTESPTKPTQRRRSVDPAFIIERRVRRGTC